MFFGKCVLWKLKTWNGDYNFFIRYIYITTRKFIQNLLTKFDLSLKYDLLILYSVLNKIAFMYININTLISIVYKVLKSLQFFIFYFFF